MYKIRRSLHSKKQIIHTVYCTSIGTSAEHAFFEQRARDIESKFRAHEHFKDFIISSLSPLATPSFVIQTAEDSSDREKNANYS